MAENSSILRRFEEIFPKGKIDPKAAQRSAPDLFTTFLSKRARSDPSRPSLGFSLDVGVLVPEYQVDGALWLKNHYPGGYLFRDKLNLDVTPPEDGDGEWKLAYGWDSKTPNRASISVAPILETGCIQFRIPVRQNTKPGITADLVLRARSWNIGTEDAPPVVAPVN